MPNRKSSKGRIHVNIGDTQVKKGVPTKHLQWIGCYVYDQFYGQDVCVVHNGDHWDFPSLSSYDEGKVDMEGRRYLDDVQAGNDGLAELTEPVQRRKRFWKPELHMLRGNHEARLTRICENVPKLTGTLSFEHLNDVELGWTVHEFLVPVNIDGIVYAHYFYNPKTGKPYAGENLYTRLKQIGHTFTMGHQQGVNYAMRPVGHTRHQGLVNGSTYLHDEKYLGPQGNADWRGIVVCHQVENGTYDPMFVSLEYLCRRYERKTLKEFLGRK